MQQMLLKIKTVLGQMAICPRQPYYEAFISPRDSHTKSVYTFCIQKLYKMCTTDAYKVYIKCIPYFDKLLYTFCIQNQKNYTTAKFCIQRIQSDLFIAFLNFVREFTLDTRISFLMTWAVCIQRRKPIAPRHKDR